MPSSIDAMFEAISNQPEIPDRRLTEGIYGQCRDLALRGDSKVSVSATNISTPITTSSP